MFKGYASAAETSLSTCFYYYKRGADQFARAGKAIAKCNTRFLLA